MVENNYMVTFHLQFYHFNYIALFIFSLTQAVILFPLQKNSPKALCFLPLYVLQ